MELFCAYFTSHRVIHFFYSVVSLKTNTLYVTVTKLKYKKKLMTLWPLTADIDLQPFIIRWKICSHFSFVRVLLKRRIRTYLHICLYENLRSFSRHYSMSSPMFWRGDQMKAFVFLSIALVRDKSLLESWGTTFHPDWQPPLIFVWFTSKSHSH